MCATYRAGFKYCTKHILLSLSMFVSFLPAPMTSGTGGQLFRRRTGVDMVDTVGPGYGRLGYWG